MITIPEIRAIAIEAWETVETMPETARMPSVKTYWPEWTRDDAGETFPVRLLPSAEQIGRAERFFDAVNRLDTQAKRSAIHQWIKVKVSRNCTVRGYSEKMGLREHQYRSWIDKIFQEVADNFRPNPGLMVFEEVEPTPKISDKRSTSDEARPNWWVNQNRWMAEGAKPRAEAEPNIQNCMKAMLARAAIRNGHSPDRQRAEG